MSALEKAMTTETKNPEDAYGIRYQGVTNDLRRITAGYDSDREAASKTLAGTGMFLIASLPASKLDQMLAFLHEAEDLIGCVDTGMDERLDYMKRYYAAFPDRYVAPESEEDERYGT